MDKVRCIATCFGYRDPGDNGKGAWGADTNNTHLIGVSLPLSILRESLGGSSAEIVKKYFVSVNIINNGGSLRKAPIVDIGPGEKGALIWDRHFNIGHVLDLTYGACMALGVKYDAEEASYLAEFWIEDETGNPIVVKGLEGPKHYV